MLVATECKDKLGADPELLTVSGFSAGANLVLGIPQQEGLCLPAKTAVKTSVIFGAPVSKPNRKALYISRDGVH